MSLRLSRILSGILLIGVVGVCGLAGAQQPAAVPGRVPAPVPTPKPDPMRTDWPNLKRFQAEDTALPMPMADEKRVVFMGDSITQNWLHNGVAAGEPDAPFFPGGRTPVYCAAGN